METNLWAFVIIGGPILFIAVALFVIVSNRRRRSADELARTEEATHELYRELDAEDKARDNQPR